ncbi:hypothetical protein R0J90_24495, partial [Micrococcus sp. SIMBA_144]
DPILDEEEWNNLQTIMDEAGELPQTVDHKTLVNTSIAEKAAKEDPGCDFKRHPFPFKKRKMEACHSEFSKN